MFKVKYKKTNEVVVVLGTYLDPIYSTTYFLIWENEGWRWREASRFVPPNYEVKDNKNG